MGKNDLMFDKRTVASYLRHGAISPAELQAWIKALPDRAKDAEWVEMEKLASRSYLRGIRGADPEPQG